MTEELLLNLGLNIDTSKLEKILNDINEKLKNTIIIIKQTSNCLKSDIKADILMMVFQYEENLSKKTKNISNGMIIYE